MGDCGPQAVFESRGTPAEATYDEKFVVGVGTVVLASLL